MPPCRIASIEVAKHEAKPAQADPRTVNPSMLVSASDSL